MGLMSLHEKEETPQMRTQRKGHVRTEGEGGHLQAKESSHQKPTLLAS